MKPTLPHHVGTRDGDPSWKNLGFPFTDGSREGGPSLAARHESTTKVDGMMKRLGGALVPVSRARRALCFFRLLSSAPPNACVSSPSIGGCRSDRLLLFVIFQLVFFPPQAPVHCESNSSVSPSLLSGRRSRTFSPAPFIGPEVPSQPTPSSSTPFHLSFSRSILSSPHRLFCHTTYGTIPVAC